MSHEIKYLTYDVSTPISRIEAEIQHYVSCRTVEEGGHGLNDPIRWRGDTIYADYDQAYAAINTVDRPYDQIAVKYRVYPKAEPSAAMKTLEARLSAEQQKRVDYAKKHSVSTFKAEYVGCPTCGSKLKKELLSGEHCPLCRGDLRGKTTLETLAKYSENIKELQNKIQIERRKQQQKMEKQSKLVWLVKIEYHV